MTQIGTTLKKKRPATRPDLPVEVEVVGQKDGAYIVTDARAFAPPISLSAVELAQVYGGDGSSPVEVDEIRLLAEQAMRKMRGTAYAADRPPRETGGSSAPSPEQIFRAAEQTAEEDA